MKVRTPLFVLIVLAASLSSRAQYLEGGVIIGAANYMGDISDQRFHPQETNLLMGFVARYLFTTRLAARASVIRGALSGNDANSLSPQTRLRNLHFRTAVFEFSAVGEYNLSDYNIRDHKTSVPYLFAGISLLHFNPQAQMHGKWYDLQPLHTEDDRYNRTILALPFGVGVKFNLTYKVNFGVEIGARKTFSDYLDDVSNRYPDVLTMRSSDPFSAALAYRTPELTGEFDKDPSGLLRGNPQNKDWYFIAGITLTVNLTDKYGLDFDPKYEIFKQEHKQPKSYKPVKEKSRSTRWTKLRDKWRLKRMLRKAELQPVVKKRTK